MRNLILLALVAFILWNGMIVVSGWLDREVEAVEVDVYFYHVVMPGDTLWGIANTHFPKEHTGQRVHEIRQINPGIDPLRLQVGQRVKIPGLGG